MEVWVWVWMFVWVCEPIMCLAMICHFTEIAETKSQFHRNCVRKYTQFNQRYCRFTTPLSSIFSRAIIISLLLIFVMWGFVIYSLHLFPFVHETKFTMPSDSFKTVQLKMNESLQVILSSNETVVTTFLSFFIGISAFWLYGLSFKHHVSKHISAKITKHF